MQFGATRSKAGKKKTPDSEGRKRIVRHVSYERSQNKRTRAIKIHGTICGFDFDEFYGRVYADGHIQIHHIKAKVGKQSVEILTR